MEKRVLDCVEMAVSSLSTAKQSLITSSKWLNKTLPSIEIIEEHKLMEKTIKDINELHQLVSEKYESIHSDFKKYFM